MAEIPIIQVLSRTNYEDQHIVPLPNALPLPALPPSSLRIKTKLISLSTNNLTYARVGHLLGWWDIHLLPDSIPAEYADPKKFGRISGWGYGVVIESTIPDVVVGTELYGYLPIGTLPVDVEAHVNEKVPGQVMVTSKHRQHVFPVYNRYIAYPPSKLEKISDLKQSQGYDSLMQILFETSYMMNRFLFAWDDTQLAHPTGDPKLVWTPEEAHIGPKTTVIIFSPSGKTALAFAYNLKHARPAARLPHAIIGVGSSNSQSFSEGTGLYDKVLTYEADSGDLTMELGLHPDSNVVIVDFGARGNAPARWVAKLRPSYKLTHVDIGGEVVPDSPEKTTEKIVARGKSGNIRANASVLRDFGMASRGEKEYFEEFYKEWEAFKAQGGVKGLTLVWGNGMEDLKKGWESLCEGKVEASQGLLFNL